MASHVASISQLAARIRYVTQGDYTATRQLNVRAYNAFNQVCARSTDLAPCHQFQLSTSKVKGQVKCRQNSTIF